MVEDRTSLLKEISALNCRVTRHALRLVVLGRDIETAIYEAEEADIELTLMKAKAAGVKV